MTVIKVRDLAWARMRAPDLDAMEEFLRTTYLNGAGLPLPKKTKPSTSPSPSPH